MESIHYTKADKDAFISKLMGQTPLLEVRDVFPAAWEGMKEWGTDAYRDQFMKYYPAPLRYLMVHYFIPDYHTSIKPKRDAPFLDTKPVLTRKRCCGIFFCCRCII